MSTRARGRPRGVDALDARRRLLEAALRVFSERGYRAASVDQLVGEAGLSKGTFYWHFVSKEEAFLALLEDRLDRPAQQVMELTRDAPADAPTAGDVSHALSALLSTERDVVLLLHEYWAAASRDERLAERYRDRQRVLRDSLADALASRHARTGVPLTMPATRLAEAFIALANGLSLAALVDPEAVDPELFGEILSLVYDGMVLRSREENGRATT